MPKTFLAVNLSDAFTFQEKQQQNDNEALEMKPIAHGELAGPLQPGEPVEAVTDSATGEEVSDTPTPAEATVEAPVDTPTTAATTVASTDVLVPETTTLGAPTEEAVGGAGGEKAMD